VNARRITLERIAQAVADGLENSLGRGVELGLHGSFDDHEVTQRNIPLRAVMTTFEGALQDVLIVVTNMREDIVVPAVAAAGVALAEELGASSRPSPPQVFEFTQRDEALEQLEALYDEPTVHYTTPKGELLVVLGSGLVRSVQVVTGMLSRPADEEAAGEPGMDFGDDGRSAALAAFEADLTGDDTAVAFGDEGPVDYAAAADRVLAGDAPTFEPDKVAQPFAATAAQNALAALPIDSPWATLLSGVEVEVSAELGRTSMRLGEVASLSDESVLTLDQLVDEPVTVYVNGSLYATARLVVVENEYGIEIVEVLAAPQAVEAEPGAGALAA
jgi:flagellar motor switch protein FliN/FliY